MRRAIAGTTRQVRSAMEMAFLGTAALPTAHRSPSCILFKLGKWVHLFDCGEGSYRQFQKTSYRAHKINNIFITHMHGDHIWGLPGFLCAARFNSVAEIYGPQGLRDWLRMALSAVRGRVPFKYQVHELVLSEEEVPRKLHVPASAHEDELPGYDICRARDGIWHLDEKEDHEVKAGLLSHNVPCWGYVLRERPERTEDGRNIVILGDTFDSSSLLAEANNADVVVHEATLLRPEMENHSTAGMAGEFARLINAKCLVLTHVNKLVDQLKLENKLVEEAAVRFGKKSVLLAKDFLVVKVL